MFELYNIVTLLKIMSAQYITRNGVIELVYYVSTWRLDSSEKEKFKREN